MQTKLFCAIGFLTVVLIFQDCIVPASSVRVRVVKVRKQLDGHYTKRQVSRNSYTDVPLSGDPDPDSEAYRPNTNNLRPEDNPYNAGNRQVNYPGRDQSYNNNNNNQQSQRQPGYGDRASVSQQSTPQRQQDGANRPARKDGEKGEDCPGCGHSIPGDAGVDYPNFATPPKTTFSCSKQSYSGYYADTEARCQVFWICQKNRADAFLCPNGTIFNQQVFVCDWWFNSDCNTAPDYYSRNQYLYAGPTVDIFGNAITVNTNPTGTNPISQTSQNRRTTAAPVPIRQQAATLAPSGNGNYGSPTAAPIRQTTGYNKRSQQSGPYAHNQLQYDNPKPAPLRQQQSYPVPDNSLEAIENSNNGFGARMNNYRSAVDYIDRSQSSSPSQRQQNGNTWSYSKQQQPQQQRQQQQYNGNGYNNNNGYDSASYSDEQRQYNNNNGNRRYTPQEERQRGYNNNNDQRRNQPSNNYNNNNNNYNNKNNYNNNYNNNNNAQYRQPLFSATEPVASSIEVSTIGYGNKMSKVKAVSKSYEDSTSTSADVSAVSSAPIRTSSPAYSSSTTTKRNAIDFDTENTTPLAVDSLDEELLSTLTTPRYGEVISKPNLFSLELENPSDEDVTTTVAPLTFGEKLTRAARKRNTSRWGNWRTMLLGEEY